MITDPAHIDPIGDAPNWSTRQTQNDCTYVSSISLQGVQIFRENFRMTPLPEIKHWSRPVQKILAQMGPPYACRKLLREFQDAAMEGEYGVVFLLEI